MRDSNSQPPGSEPGALPIEPIRIIWLWMRDSNPQNTGVKARCVTFSPIHNMYPVFMAAGSHMAESTVFETDPYTRAQRLAGVLQNPLDLLSMLKIKTRRVLPAGFYRVEVKMTNSKLAIAKIGDITHASSRQKPKAAQSGGGKMICSTTCSGWIASV